MAYSDFEIAEALVKLAVNKGNYEKTAEETGVSIRTIKRWAKTTPKKGVPALLERAIERLLMVIPEKWTGTDWGITLGILMDKWFLLQGQPTSRTEEVVKQFGSLSDDEYRRVIDEAERILESARIGGSMDSCFSGDSES